MYGGKTRLTFGLSALSLGQVDAHGFGSHLVATLADISSAVVGTYLVVGVLLVAVATIVRLHVRRAYDPSGGSPWSPALAERKEKSERGSKNTKD
jgi:hypothetical protein